MKIGQSFSHEVPGRDLFRLDQKVLYIFFLENSYIEYIILKMLSPVLRRVEAETPIKCIEEKRKN